MEMKDRIAEIIKAKGVTSQQFAEIINVQSSTISHILSERNKPSLNIVMSIMESLPEINPDWLLSGTGEMYRCENNEMGLNGANFEHNEASVNDGVFNTDNDHSTNVRGANGYNHGYSSLQEASQHTTTPSTGAYRSDLQMFDNCENIEKIMVFYNDKSFDIYKPR